MALWLSKIHLCLECWTVFAVFMSYSADAMSHISMYNTESSCQRTLFLFNGITRHWLWLLDYRVCLLRFVQDVKMTQRDIFFTRIQKCNFHKICCLYDIRKDYTFRADFLFHYTLVFWSVLCGISTSQWTNFSVPPKRCLSQNDVQKTYWFPPGKSLILSYWVASWNLCDYLRVNDFFSGKDETNLMSIFVCCCIA